jgi:ABC-2 type transport system permease protein
MNLERLAAAIAAQLKMIFRNRAALFWGLAFPIILLTLLGGALGGSVNAGTLAVVDEAHQARSVAVVRALRLTNGITVKLGTDPATARKQVHDGDRDAALVLTKATGASSTVDAHLYTSNTSVDQASIIRSIVSAVTTRIATPSPAITPRSSSVDSSDLDYVDFLVPGIVAIAIMTSSVIGLATILVDWRTRGILRRLKLTPMPLAEFFVSRIAASLCLTLLQVAVLLAFGRIAFGVHISSAAWASVPVAIAGALAFLSLGLLIGSAVATPETADATSNAITFPMMFLSGTFFPVAALPAWLGEFARVLPLYYLANGLRDTAVRGLSITHVAGDIGVLLAATAVLAAISLRTFRWEPST